MHRPAFVLLILIVCLASHLTLFVEGFTKCESGFYYVERKKNGQPGCRRCDNCNRAGYGLNQSAQLEISDEYGYVECYPCVECPDAYYRDADEPAICLRCARNCSSQKRYVLEPCGGTKKGQCGDCFIGYEAPNRDRNSICRNKTTTLKPQSLESKLDVQPISPLKPDADETGSSEFLVLYIGCGGAVGIVISVVSIAFVKSRIMHAHNRTSATEAASMVKLLQSNNSGVNTSVPVIENDIETDGHVGSKARGELPTIVAFHSSHQPECRYPTQHPPDATFQYVVETEGDKYITPKVNRNYPKHVIKKDDARLGFVSKFISGKDQVNNVFKCLNIHKAKIEPEFDLFTMQKHSYPDFILNVLFRWVEKDGNDATLDRLCEALEMAGFSEIVGKLLESETVLSSSSGFDYDTENDSSSTTATDDIVDDGDAV